MADDATHARNRRMTVMLTIAFVVLVVGIALHIGWLTAMGIGAGLTAFLGRYWS